MRLMEALESAIGALGSYSMQGNDDAEAAIKVLEKHRMTIIKRNVKNRKNKEWRNRKLSRFLDKELHALKQKGGM